MKRTIIAALLIVTVGLSAGCCNCGQHRLCGRRAGCRQGCGLFANRGCGIFGHPGCGARGGSDDGAVVGGPPTAQVTYPYYTTRGPRDFLQDNPRGIGP
ncbi:MAG TPA: hypothetical protein VGX76_06500 [Pirellulales bacterium]|jgi:hypothetical protein|nr:hypothetical protein [Pirellulales bacterium]